MNTLLTQAANGGHRNSSLLGAFALVLAFAFSVGSTSTPAFTAGQQLLPADVSLPLLADIDAPFDIAIPVAAAVFAASDARSQVPQAGVATQLAALPPAAFLARAPPV
jgi:hypothetical protein